MHQYEERLENDLRLIRDMIGESGRRVETALKQSCRALFTRDLDLAYHTILEDQAINRLAKSLDRRCHEFVARHLPSAGHLRFVSAALRVNIALERIGDYAVTLCRETVRLSSQPHGLVRRDLDLLVEEVQAGLAEALDAFAESNPDLARGTKDMLTRIGRGFDRVFEDLAVAAREESRSIQDLFSLLLIFNRLSRVCDQAQNICEETVFSVTGKLKGPKRHKILFVDERNDCKSKMAEAIARKGFPESGDYSSAGWAPLSSLSPGFIRFMDSHGHDVAGTGPARLETAGDLLNDYDLVVALESGFSDHVPEIPYHVILQHWCVDRCPNRCPTQEVDEKAHWSHYEAIYRQVAQLVAELMEILVGEEHS